ncbi:hypothetical protein D3C71_1090810 [compost metagenome]
MLEVLCIHSGFTEVEGVELNVQSEVGLLDEHQSEVFRTNVQITEPDVRLHVMLVFVSVCYTTQVEHRCLSNLFGAVAVEVELQYVTQG